MPFVIRYGWTRGQPPPQCRGNAEATELYNSLFIGTLEKHPRFSLHCYTNPFSWLNEWKDIVDEQGRSLGLEFILPDWLYDGIINQQLVLSIDPAYFNLTSGIERWLYRVVRKHGGRQKTGWSFMFRQLYEKSGSIARFSDFAIDIRKIVARQSIPEYWLSIHRNGQGEEILHFIRRSCLPPGHEGATGVELQKRRILPELSMD